MNQARAVWGNLFAAILLFGCAQPPVFPPRTLVGSMPEGLMRRPVTSAADAAAYVDEYARALRVEDVRAVRVLGFGTAYWVYAVETKTGRPAFSLEVGATGDIGIRRFPAMDPEMMWNQKYGHRARPDPAMIEAGMGEAKAAGLLRQALPTGGKLRPGRVSAYYGYYLYPLCEEGKPAGEAAVSAVDGAVLWKRFPEPPRSSWSLYGPDTWLCEQGPIRK